MIKEQRVDSKEILRFYKLLKIKQKKTTKLKTVSRTLLKSFATIGHWWPINFLLLFLINYHSYKNYFIFNN